MTDEILAEIQAAPGRRWLAVVMMVLAGGMVIWVAFASPPTLGWQVFLLVTGGLFLWLAEKMRRATEASILLTEAGLVESTGEVIADMEDIVAIDRGVLAFKPSNGFLVTLSGKRAGAWRPGLWWRLGRRIGIGGVTPASQTKFMSEIIAARLAQRGDA